MTVYLLRHARAGRRSAWKGDDELRPLSKVGRNQSVAIADALEHAGIEHVRSSPFVRCLQTVEPLALRIGVAVEDDEALAEGMPVDQTLRLIEKAAQSPTVLCTHGDIVEAVLAHLKRNGVKVGKAPMEKGSAWALDLADGVVVGATYLPPPRSSTKT